MHVREGSQTIRDGELDRHAEALSRLQALAGKAGPPTPACTLILRSPASVPARALVAMRETLAETNARFRAILARLEPEADLRTFCETLTALAPKESSASLVRWARNRRLWDAHEQAAYGPNLCWCGDPIRRDAGKRNALALFETTPEAASHAAHAFAALWEVSAPVPARLLDGGARVSPSATREHAIDGAVSALRPPAQGWPLVRH